MAQTDELKPCPFCGGAAQINKHFRDEAYNLVHRCHALGPIVIDWTDRERLVRCWNMRTSSGE